MLPIRILLVDASPKFLGSATRFLSEDPGIEFVGRALLCAEAIQQVALVHPDPVLMDWEMPGMSGLEATHHIKARPGAQADERTFIAKRMSDEHTACFHQRRDLRGAAYKNIKLNISPILCSPLARNTLPVNQFPALNTFAEPAFSKLGEERWPSSSIGNQSYSRRTTHMNL